MTSPDIRRLYVANDALGLAELVRDKQVSPLELVETAIEAIEECNPSLNAVVIKTYDIARKAASQSLTGPFAGVPFLLKNIGSMWEGTPLNNGFSYLQNVVCDHDTEMVRRIKDAGFLMLGRTNAPEGGWSIGTEPRLYGPTHNPWDQSLTPGGSSGGAAASVSSRMIPLAEASDGGGSTRAPASCCGLVGLKPSRGRITYGPKVADFWHGSVSTFCVTRTVRDTAAYLDATAGALTGDPYIAPTPDQSWLELSAKAPKRLRVGYVAKAAWGDPTAPEVDDAVTTTLGLLGTLGHEVTDHDLGVDLHTAWRDYNIINCVEMAADFDRLAVEIGRPVRDDELAPVNRSLIERGRACSATEYSKAIAAVRLTSQRIAASLETYDVFLTPVLNQLPRPIGYWSMEETDLDAYLDRWADAGYLFAFNISGLPAMSVPVTMTNGGIPVGMQLVGRYGDEATILQLAGQLEQEVRWHERTPPFMFARS